MVKFYKITFKNKFGNRLSTVVVGNAEQVRAWADKECYAWACSCEITELAEHEVEVKNLCNY